MTRALLKEYRDELQVITSQYNLLKLRLQVLNHQTKNIARRVLDSALRFATIYDQINNMTNLLLSEGYSLTFLNNINILDLEIEPSKRRVQTRSYSVLLEIFYNRIRRLDSLKKEFSVEIQQYIQYFLELKYTLKIVSKQAKLKNYFETIRTPYLKEEIRSLEEKLSTQI